MSVEDDGSSTTSSATSDTQAGTSPIPDGWPQDWYGEYYEEPSVNLGQEYSDIALIYVGFWNMRLERAAVVLEHFDSGVDDIPQEWSFAVELEGDALRVVPPAGRWEILFPGADDVSIHPGVECDELVLEVHTSEGPDAPFYTRRWHRGRMCLVDPYDDTVFDDRWMVDLCPGTVTTCDGG